MDVGGKPVKQPTGPVSVLMSTFNRGHFIAQSIEGILNQSLRPRQVIIVNDGSTDDTENVLSGFGDRIQYIRQENAGKSKALNRVIPLATEEFIWIFDDDDVPFQDALERLMRALEENPWAGFAYGPWQHCRTGPDGQRIPCHTAPMLDVPSEDLFPRLLEVCFLLQQGSLVRSSCFKSVGGYRETLKRSLDYDFLIRLARRYSGIRVQDPLFHLRLHDGPRGGAADKFSASERDRKWYESDQVIFGELYEDLDLWEYLPLDRQKPAPETFDVKTALFRRIGVMGSKGLWERVIEDIDRLKASGYLGEPLTGEQRRAIKTAFRSEHSVLALVEDRGVTDKFATALRNANDTELTLSFTRWLYWKTTEGRLTELGNRFRIFAAIIQIVGAKELSNALFVKIGLRKTNGKRRDDHNG